MSEAGVTIGFWRSRGARQLVISRGWRVGLLVAMASAVLFTAAGFHVSGQGYVAQGVAAQWSAPAFSAESVGHWTQNVFISMARALPGATSAAMMAMTITAAAAVQAVIAHDLAKRGWPPVLVAFTTCVAALHPVMLFMATSGTPMLLYVIAATLVILAVDRLEAISDTQAMIVLGLAQAGLLFTWPDAVFFILPLLTLLPVAFRTARSPSAILAMYVIVLAPGIILVTAAMVGASLFQLSASEALTLTVWESPLHGEAPQAIASNLWLQTYGGHPLEALCQLLAVCAVVAPCVWLIAFRFLAGEAERERPATGLTALLLPATAGALGAGFWQIGSPWIIAALSLLGSAAWSATARFRRWERWFWAGSLAVGTIGGWLTPVLWQSPDMIAWRAALLAPVHGWI